MADVVAAGYEAVDGFEATSGVPYRDGVGYFVLDFAAGGVEEGSDDVVVDGFAAHDAGLVQQAERVSGRAFRLAGDRVRGADGLLRHVGFLRRQRVREVPFGDAANIQIHQRVGNT